MHTMETTNTVTPYSALEMNHYKALHKSTDTLLRDRQYWYGLVTMTKYTSIQGSQTFLAVT